MRKQNILRCLIGLAWLFTATLALAQTTGATFGEVISLGGTPSDIVLDEARQRLYLVNTNANRVDIYSYRDKAIIGSIRVGTSPLAAAMSPDGAYLYVTNNQSASLSVIDLGTRNVVQTLSLPARPEGVAVGADGRVLISTQGTGTGNLQNTLLIYDRDQAVSQQILPVQYAPPPPTPSPLPAVTLPRPISPIRTRLIATPDGQFIVGLTNYTTSAMMLFVYEVASGTILRSRAVSGQSSVLSMAPDGSRFMAGFTMYRTSNLNVIAQQSTANSPFPFPAASFNVQQNVGGGVFSPDGSTLYSAFNVAATSLPAPRPQSSILMISDASNLSIRLGIKLPESIVARMVITSDGEHAWGLSESGLIYLPLGKLYDYPILQPETTQVFLASDLCRQGIARASVRVVNLGKGKLTFSVPPLGNALVAEVSSGVVPATVTFVMEPGRFNVNRQPGTNLYSGNSGSPVNVNLVSPEAINIPNTIRIYMNYRQADQRGIIFPVPSTLYGEQGLQDLVLDEPRGLLYASNTGYNRIEIFDIKKLKFLEPIKVGQLPRQMAMSLDGSLLYVGHAGGELVSIVDLEQRKAIGEIEFPPVPRNASAGIIYPRALAMGLSGLQITMSNGTMWKVVGNQAVPRPANTNIFPNNTVSGPQEMTATPGGEYILLLGGTGMAYLYDALVDNYTVSRQVYTPNQQIISYYGVLGAAPRGAYYLANGLILSPSIAVIGGAERPGVVQVAPPTTPGGQPTQTVVSAGQRHVAAVAPLDERSFVRLTTAVRQSVTAATRDDVRPVIEQVDIATGAETVAAIAAEQPTLSAFGQARINLSPRRMVVDSKGNIYAITLSGLSYIPLTPPGAGRPTIRGGARGILNSIDGTPNFTPGAFVTVLGSNLALPATADEVPPPTVLGGSCVTFSDLPLRLLQTSPEQISAQLPEDIRPGQYVVQVRSLATAQASDPVVVTVQRPPVTR
jgi:YVTN family beta-propeller protein